MYLTETGEFEKLRREKEGGRGEGKVVRRKDDGAELRRTELTKLAEEDG